MNILIIEDDIILAEKIKKVFEKKIISNRIVSVNTYDLFLTQLSIIRSYDIIITDINLEPWNKSWLDIIKIIRKKKSWYTNSCNKLFWRNTMARKSF